jgi:hypothetical protein
MYTELQLRVKADDKEFVKNFLSGSNQSGKLRQVMYAAELCDNLEIATFCLQQGWIFDKATIHFALRENAFKIANMLYKEAVKRKYENILQKCDGIVCDSFLPQTKAYKAAKWLLSKGYKFPYYDLLGLICNDDATIFEVAFASSNYDSKQLINDCLKYEACRILHYLQTKGLSITEIVRTQKERQFYFFFEQIKKKRENAAFIIQMHWQNCRVRNDPSVSIKEAEKAWKAMCESDWYKKGV